MGGDGRSDSLDDVVEGGHGYAAKVSAYEVMSMGVLHCNFG